ncbi:MAG: hypothetical protein KBE09_04795 [Candidatus Pacebacteria bacterium]|nr:hypothetical protein [Candidatus Paceibacterota bacterium]
MNQNQDQYPIDKRSHARQAQTHTAPRLEGVVKNVGTTKKLKAKGGKKLVKGKE